LGSHTITNQGDEADLVVAFNEQVLYGRILNGAYREGTVILLEKKWADDPSAEIREQYATALKDLHDRGFVVRELAIEQACLEYTENPRLGKNMFVLGMLCWIFQRDIKLAEAEIEVAFARKKREVIDSNIALMKGGVKFAEENVPECYVIPPREFEDRVIVCNGNQAVGLGVMASGMEMVAMYPITPATSASHHLAGVFHHVGGFVHQAEDEIAAIGFALGASYAGKTACTITSGPGMALKTEFMALAVMTELPLVIVDVQRGGPSTCLPTKVEQGDLLYSVVGVPGDAPRAVMAAATIEECFHFVITARKLAEAFRMPVIVLTDANLATGVQPIARPKPQEDWFAAPIDQSPWQDGVDPYAWDEVTGLSPRPIPGQAGGEYVLTGLAHTSESHVAYNPEANQIGCEMRSRKLATLRSTLKPPGVNGDDSGDLLVVGWGSTLGAIEEAVERARKQGHSVSSLHLRFLSPLEPGLEEIFSRFKKVLTVELNYSDPSEGFPGVTQPPRLAQLAALLRMHTLHEVDWWSITPGQPLYPKQIYDVIVDRMAEIQDYDDPQLAKAAARR
jgi:2-oxoglutarate ferredoxin oxidoreductase subunit alpha